jgi:hypothetical protein
MHHPTPPAYPAPFSHNHPHSLQAQQGRVGHSTYGDQGRTSPAAPPPVTAAGSLSDEELDEFAQLEADTRGMLVGRRSLNQVERYLKGHMQESGRAQGHNFQHQQQQVLGGAKRRPGSAQGAAGYGTAQAGIMRGARAGAVGKWLLLTAQFKRKACEMVHWMLCNRNMLPVPDVPVKDS